MEDEIARQIASTLNRPLKLMQAQRRPRFSKDPMAYAEFMHGYRLSSAGDSTLLDEAVQRLSNAVTRDPDFSLAHATLSLVCAMRHFELDTTSVWLEAEFHCRRAISWTPIWPKVMSPKLSCFGGHRKISSTWKRLRASPGASSAAQSAACLQSLARYWRISGYSITLGNVRTRPAVPCKEGGQP
jgi:hypothetical protein